MIFSYYLNTKEDLNTISLVEKGFNKIADEYAQIMCLETAKTVLGYYTVLREFPELKVAYDKVTEKQLRTNHIFSSKSRIERLFFLRKFAREVVRDEDLASLKILLTNGTLNLYLNPENQVTLNRSRYNGDPEAEVRAEEDTVTFEPFENLLIRPLAMEFKRRLIRGETGEIDQLLADKFELWDSFSAFGGHVFPFYPRYDILTQAKVERFSRIIDILSVRSVAVFCLWMLLMYYPYRPNNFEIIDKVSELVNIKDDPIIQSLRAKSYATVHLSRKMISVSFFLALFFGFFTHVEALVHFYNILTEIQNTSSTPFSSILTTTSATILFLVCGPILALILARLLVYLRY